MGRNNGQGRRRIRKCPHCKAGFTSVGAVRMHVAWRILREGRMFSAVPPALRPTADFSALVHLLPGKEHRRKANESGI